MKVLLIGGRSSLAQALLPVLKSFSAVMTAGRSGCDLDLDLSWPIERWKIPTGLDAVIHLAAHFGGRDFDDMLAAEETNAVGALKVAHACANAGAGHLVQVSSIFAGLARHSPFYTIYALSKRHAEELADLYCANVGLPLAILRPGQFYGPGEAFRRHQPFLYFLLDRAQRGEEIVLFGNNDALRNFIHVADLAEIIARVVRQRIEGRYDCTGLSNIRLSEIATMAVATFGGSSSVRFDRSKADIPDNDFPIDGTLYTLIGYFPTTSLEQGFSQEADLRRDAS